MPSTCGNGRSRSRNTGRLVGRLEFICQRARPLGQQLQRSVGGAPEQLVGRCVAAQLGGQVLLELPSGIAKHQLELGARIGRPARVAPQRS